MKKQPVKIVECPRDAMQGYKSYFSTVQKIDYMQKLLSVGFDVLDCGSFVSPKAIPQMADSGEVISALDLSQTQTKLLAIIANVRGAQNAILNDKITYLGYPFSISETFQKRNTNKSIEESLIELKEIMGLAASANKSMVVYLSMGFGNPYGEAWSLKLVEQWVEKLVALGATCISLSDTVGTAKLEDLYLIFNKLIKKYPNIEFGAHLHCKPYEWNEKIEAAYKGGCRRFDGALRGFGGFPMATDDLTGNMPTEGIVSYFKANLPTNFSFPNFDNALLAADRLFKD